MSEFYSEFLFRYQTDTPLRSVLLSEGHSLLCDETKDFAATSIIKAVRAVCRYVNNAQAEIDNNISYSKVLII